LYSLYAWLFQLNASVSDNDACRICFSNKPSGELQAFFRRHFSNVTFIQGTVLDIPTLKLAKVCMRLYHRIDNLYSSMRHQIETETDNESDEI